MDQTNNRTYTLPFVPTTNPGFHVRALLGGGETHLFRIDTGSVGILVPRNILGPEYPRLLSSPELTFGYISSGNSYSGQWVKVPVALGVPAAWDGTGDYPAAEIEVFAVDDPADFEGGLLGIGFAIGEQADGGPLRNPLLHLSYQGNNLSPGYIMTQSGLQVGLTALNTQDFGFIPLTPNAAGTDWTPPTGRVVLAGAFSPAGFTADLPLLLDTGVEEMIIWTSAGHTPPNIAKGMAFPKDITVTVSAPPPSEIAPPWLHYSFQTGETTPATAPAEVEWRIGNGLNTGMNVLAAFDYLYDVALGRIGFRPRER